VAEGEGFVPSKRPHINTLRAFSIAQITKNAQNLSSRYKTSTAESAGLVSHTRTCALPIVAIGANPLRSRSEVGVGEAECWKIQPIRPWFLDDSADHSVFLDRARLGTVGSDNSVVTSSRAASVMRAPRAAPFPAWLKPGVRSGLFRPDECSPRRVGTTTRFGALPGRVTLGDQRRGAVRHRPHR
jgi:hypothetical protein